MKLVVLQSAEIRRVSYAACKFIALLAELLPAERAEAPLKEFPDVFSAADDE